MRVTNLRHEHPKTYEVSNMSDLAFASATELAGRIKRKEISAAEILELYLQRVDQFNPEINAVVVDIRDQARTRALEIDAALRIPDLETTMVDRLHEVRKCLLFEQVGHDPHQQD